MHRHALPGSIAVLLIVLAACSADTPGGPGSSPGTQPRTGTPRPTVTLPSDAPATPAFDPTAAVVAGGPPAGRYWCYHVPRFIYSGWVELQPDGSYQAGYAQDEVQTEGRHRFETAEGLVVWDGGSYATSWPVTYYVEPGRYPDGSARTGTGSDRHTIALKIDPSNPLLPGQESASNPIYVYCYLQPDAD